jgi:signal transduction histidine kinase/DNA-binding LacI/PurR family transcriptional regulator/AraC-like DNA-binding protein
MNRTSGRHQPTIGVLAGWQFFWTATPLTYLSPLFRGIRAAARARGCNLLLACGMGPTASPDDPLRPAWPALASDVDFVPVGPWNTDGLLIANPLISKARSQYIQKLRDDGHPVVFIAQGERGPTVSADNESGITQAIQHLVAHGHRQIAFIAGNPDDVEGDSGDRLKAYRAAMQHFGLAVDLRLVVAGHHTSSSGYRAMRQILESAVKFTAVLASNDESAIGAMQALHEAGLRIPQDVAIIGFDDRAEALVQSPPLTSVHVPLVKLGYQALEFLLDSIEGHAPASEVSKVHTHLIVRQSCGCLASGLAPVLAAGSEAAPSVEASRSSLAQVMTEAVLAEAQRLSADAIRPLCEGLVGACLSEAEAPESNELQSCVADILRQTELAGDDVQIWQSAISVLRRHVPELCPSVPGAEWHARVVDALDRARLFISEGLRRQHWQYVVDQMWRTDRIGQLTAQLLTALDRPQVFEVLARHLPAMGIEQAAVAFFEPEGNDPVAWSRLHNISHLVAGPIRFRTREFPPVEWVPEGQEFGLALLPLVIRGQQHGFVAFDTAHMELDGAIARQLAAALNTAQLYTQASQGRQLAEEANRLKGRFLSTVSHELRTPLSLIVGLSEILLQKGASQASLPASVRQDLGQIRSNAQHLGWLIRDVLDLASSEAGQLRLTNDVLDLSQTLREVVDVGRRMAQDKGLAWRQAMPESGPWVWGDQTRLRQVALNLVSNAVKFTSQGEVRLDVDVGEGNVTVRVSDTGLGIPPQEQPYIFDEFRQSERTATRGYGGLGLGLAICKRLVELHGGHIAVESSGVEGAGSTFSFTLPTVAQPATLPDPQAPPAAGEAFVLLLANRSENGERLHRHLVEQGFDLRVVWADQSDDWLSPLALKPPGAVVLDVSLAPKQGWDLLNLIKSNPAIRDAPVLFYSLAPGGGSVFEVQHLTKPVGVTELASALSRHGLLTDETQANQAVLIVDDEPAILDMHARIVQAHWPGCQIIKARNGREALEALRRGKPNLMLLDLMMPELDGFGVLEAMRTGEATRDIPVIVLTGQILTEKDMERLNQGVATVLEKGLFSVDETLAHIEAALVRKRKLGSDAQRLVRRAMAYLHEHYTEPLSREALARHVGMSDDYLTYCFRQELAMTPIAYLNRYRVHQAKSLLAASDKNVTETALAVGFSDSGYFSRIFRREMGVSPDAYRRIAKKA